MSFWSAGMGTPVALLSLALTSVTYTMPASASPSVTLVTTPPTLVSWLTGLTVTSAFLNMAVATAPHGTSGAQVTTFSEEQNVGGVATKVTLGEADAGIVYVTDVKANEGKATGVAIPADQNDTTAYPIAPLKSAPNPTAAAAFVSYVLGPQGQAVLASFGFQPPK